VQAGEEDLLEYVRSKPTGKYARCLWFLYEFLTGKTLPLDDLKRGNYIDLADLMDGLAAAHERMNTGGVSAVIQAAASSPGVRCPGRPGRGCRRRVARWRE